MHLAECAGDELEEWVARIAPSELLYSADVTPAFEQRLQACAARACSLTQRPEWQFDAGLGQPKLLEQLKAASLAAWGAQELPQAHAAAAALLAYAEHTQGRALTHVHSVRVQRNDQLIDLPQTTRRNLELVQTLRGEDSPTLFSLLDTCMTGMGSRLLKNWLLEPRRDRAPAQQRLDAITALREGAVADAARALKGCSDVERITARIALRQVRPRELVALQQTLQKRSNWRRSCTGPAAAGRDRAACRRRPAAPSCWFARSWTSRRRWCATAASSPAGLDAELDELRAIQNNCDGFLLDLETRERARTGIANLRVQFNKVHGFYIEVTQGQLDNVPDDYRRRQTLKNAERFITPELKAFEDKALSAQERALAREKWLYEQLLDQLQAFVPALTRLARALATLDVLCALTERSLTLELVRAAVREGARHRHHAGPPPGGAGRAWPRPAAAPSSPTTRSWARSSACRSSPAPTWAASRPTCARWR